jgi:uncharacterized protein YoxC
MTSLDDIFDHYLNNQLAQKLGEDYEKICNNIDKLIKMNNVNCDEIKILKADIKEYYDKCKSLQDAINETLRKNKELEQRISRIEALGTLIKQVNDRQSQYGQQVNNQIAEISQRCDKLENEKNNLVKKVLALEEENRKLSQKPETLIRNNNLFHQGDNGTQKGQNDIIIAKFNNWAANPVFGNIPGEFAYLMGDFRIRMNQQEITETAEEAKWIINREGKKKYLLPNPNFFNPMTNISELYKMDLNMLKAQGKNKIRIITPCEISPSGFIELPGELKIL